jgi:hypothetical protein
LQVRDLHNLKFFLKNPEKLFDLQSVDKFHFAFVNFFMGESLCHYVLQQDSIQKLVHSTDLHFGVVNVEDFVSECFLGFAHKFQEPITQVSTVKYSSTLKMKNNGSMSLSRLSTRLYGVTYEKLLIITYIVARQGI